MISMYIHIYNLYLYDLYNVIFLGMFQGQWLLYSVIFSGMFQGQWLRGMRHGYGVRTSAAFGIASHAHGGEGGRRPSISSLQPGMEETKVVMTNGGAGGRGGGEEARGGFVLKSRSDEAPVRRRSLVERTGMKNLMQVTFLYLIQLMPLSKVSRYQIKTEADVVMDTNIFLGIFTFLGLVFEITQRHPKNSEIWFIGKLQNDNTINDNKHTKLIFGLFSLIDA